MIPYTVTVNVPSGVFNEHQVKSQGLIILFRLPPTSRIRSISNYREIGQVTENHGSLDVNGYTNQDLSAINTTEGAIINIDGDVDTLIRI